MTKSGNLRIRENISGLTKIFGSVVLMVLPSIFAVAFITINQYPWTPDRTLFLIPPITVITLSLIQSRFKNMAVVEITPQGELQSERSLKTPPSSIKRIEVFKRRALFDVMIYTDDFNIEVGRYLKLEDANLLRNTIDLFINQNQTSK